MGLLIILILVASVYADFADNVNYQGKLTDNAGVPIETPVNVTFKIYDVATLGTAIWTQGPTGITPVHGLFNTELDVSGIAWDSYSALWLEITVDDGTPYTLDPREKLTSSFHALNIADGVVNQAKLKDSGAGTPGYILSSDGSGGFSWVDPGAVGGVNSVTESGATPLVFDPVVGTGNVTIGMTQADDTHDGYLSTGDWNDFDAKLDIGDNVSDLTNDAGYLDTETDPVVGAVTGIVKADGAGVISAAVAGTDYDPSNTNELQDLDLTGDVLTITGLGTPTEVDLTPYLDNTDEQTDADVDLTDWTPDLNYVTESGDVHSAVGELDAEIKTNADAISSLSMNNIHDVDNTTRVIANDDESIEFYTNSTLRGNIVSSGNVWFDQSMYLGGGLHIQEGTDVFNVDGTDGDVWTAGDIYLDNDQSIYAKQSGFPEADQKVMTLRDGSDNMIIYTNHAPGNNIYIVEGDPVDGLDTIIQFSGGTSELTFAHGSIVSAPDGENDLGSGINQFNAVYVDSMIRFDDDNAKTISTESIGGASSAMYIGNRQILVYGDQGSNWHDDSGDPGAIGDDGDYYLNNDNSDYWYKDAGSWTLEGNLRGIGWFSGTAEPVADPVYKPGDLYMRDDGAGEYEGTYYEYLDGTPDYWSEVGDLKGPIGSRGPSGATILMGADAPGWDLGDEGDYYIDTLGERNRTLYGPKPDDITWPAASINLVGPAGGRSVESGPGDPTDVIGISGDFYIDTDDHIIWGPKLGPEETVGTWVGATTTSLIGPLGPTGPRGYDISYDWSGTELGIKVDTTGATYDYNDLIGPDGPTGPEGPDGPVGPAGTGLNNRGIWAVDEDYVSGGSGSDYVFSEGSGGGTSMWICQTSHTAVDSPHVDPTDWVEFEAPSGADGVDGQDAFVYIGYASDDLGADFTTTFDSALDYIAVKNTTTEIATPTVTDFTGLWKNYKGAQGIEGDPGQDAYLYVAYAGNDAGGGFTLTFSPLLNYIAIIDTNEVITPVQSDFDGLWKNYKGPAGPEGPVAGGVNQVIYNDEYGDPTGSANFQFDGDDLFVGGDIHVSNNSIHLSNGTNAVTLSAPTITADRAVTFPDNSGTVALVGDIPGNQDLTLTGNDLSLTGSSVDIDLSGYMDDTDEQDLSYTAASRTIGITGGDDAVVPLFTDTDAGLTPLSGGGTDNFLCADGSWAEPPDVSLSSEQVEDVVGGMLDGTETLISVSYDDVDGNIDFVVDNDLHNYSWTNVVDSDIPDNITIGAGGSVNDAAIPAGITRDEEWNTIAEIEAVTGVNIITSTENNDNADDLSDNDLTDIGDVNTTGLGDGQILYWDNTEGEWKPKDDAGGANQLTDLTDVNTATATNGNLLMADGTDWESVAQTSITQLGTITDGTWQGDEIGDAYIVEDYLTSYTETDPVVAGQTGIITSDGTTISSITDNSVDWNEAHGWGDHGVEGYLTGNQTITLSGDITGSGATAITTAIAPGVIVNNDINTSAAIAPSKITSGTFGGSADYTFPDDLRINSDSLILNANGTAATTVDIVATQGGEANGVLRYSTTSNRWEFANDGSTFQPIGSGAGSVASVGGNAPIVITGTAANPIVNLAIDTENFEAAAPSFNLGIKTGGINSNEILDGTIVDADVNTNAGIARSKLATGTANQIIVNDASGVMSSLANLDVARGGTGVTSWSSDRVLLSNSGGDALDFTPAPTEGAYLKYVATDGGYIWATAYSSNHVLNAGNGLIGNDGIHTYDGSVAKTFSVSTGNGIKLNGNNVTLDYNTTHFSFDGSTFRLISAYSGGSAYDTRFVNAGEANSVTSAMITNGAILSADISNGTIAEEDLDITNGPTGLNNYILSFNEPGGDFTWVNPSAIGGVNSVSGSSPIVASPTTGAVALSIAANSIDAGDIATDGVGAAEIAAGAVGASEIATGAVGTSELGTNVVTYAKMQQVSTKKLLGNAATSTGNVAEISVGSGINLSDGGVLSATGSGGTVTSVTASSPLASSGGPIPNITIQQSGSSTDGYLSSTNWNIFNGKQPAGNYITALTGDVTASGPGSAAATVARIQGVTVSTTSPSSGHVLKYNGSQWAPAADDDGSDSQYLTLAGTTSPYTLDIIGRPGGVTPITFKEAGSISLSRSGNELTIGYTDLDSSPINEIQNVVAGAGLTGGGNGASPTLDVGEGTGITVSDDAVAINTTWANAQYINEGQAADGDLNGSYPNPGVDNSQYFITSPGSSGQVWKSDGTLAGGWGTDNINDVDVNQIRSDADAWIQGDVTLLSGSNVSVTQSGNNITINSSNPGGDITEVIAGDGLTGGGSGPGAVTLDVVGGNGISAAENIVNLGALTSNWDAGSYEIRARTLESDVATGTAPLTIASTTVVTNLNADYIDGHSYSSNWGILGNSITSDEIVNGTIVNADVSTTAEIAVSKLGDGAPNQILVTDAAGTGVAWGNPDITSISGLTNANIWVGNASGIAAEHTVTGDITMTSTGVTTIGNSKVNSAKIQDGQVALVDLAGNSVNSSKVVDNSLTASDLAAGSAAASEILDGSIKEVELSATNTPGDNQILSYNSASANFTWVADNPGTDTQDLSVGAGTATTSLINLTASPTITLTAGSNVTLGESGNNITISSSNPGGDITAVNTTAPITGGATSGAVTIGITHSGDITNGGGITVSGGSNVLVGSSNATITHSNMGSSATSNNSGGTVIQDINMGSLGHVSSIGTVNLDSRYQNDGGNGDWVDHSSYITPWVNGADRTAIRMHSTGDITCNVLHANKVDPTVQIDGQLYVTWMAENIGFWIDIISEGKLSKGEFKVDLAKQPVGSDLWLFWRTIAEGTVIPLVTAQDPAILMANVEGSILTVKSISGQEDARFSFRLSGKRLDEAKKSSDEINIPEEDTDHFIDLDKFDRFGNPK